MKKFITILLTLTLILGACTASTFAASKGGAKIRVKKATYMKYKKAYKENKELKIKVKQLEKSLALKQMDYEDAMDQYEIAMEESDKLSSQNNWAWMCIKSMGLSYNNKTWTVPSTLPDKFIINGTTYYVVKEN